MSSAVVQERVERRGRGPWSDSLPPMLGRTRVQLDVSFGTISLSLGELARLVPGQRLRIDRGDGGALSIAVQGESLLRARLEQDEGCLAARLLARGEA